MRSKPSACLPLPDAVVCETGRLLPLPLAIEVRRLAVLFSNHCLCSSTFRNTHYMVAPTIEKPSHPPRKAKMIVPNFGPNTSIAPRTMTVPTVRPRMVLMVTQRSLAARSLEWSQVAGVG